jgi:glycerophosphoryl diester phosphodiesterase
MAPENTFFGLQQSFTRGVTAVEFDVKLSKDKIAFVHHDESLGRTVIDHGTKPINEYMWSELRRMNCGNYFHTSTTSHNEKQGEHGESTVESLLESSTTVEYDYSDVLIPSFEQVLGYCKHNSIWMNIEIKPSEGCEEETGREVAKMTKETFNQELLDHAAYSSVFNYHGLKESLSVFPLLSSFSFSALLSAKEAAPELPRAFLIDNLTETPDWREQLKALDAVCLHTNHKYLTEQLVHEIKCAGYALMCYTVNDQCTADRLREWGVDSICTDASREEVEF